MTEHRYLQLDSTVTHLVELHGLNSEVIQPIVDAELTDELHQILHSIPPTDDPEECGCHGLDHHFSCALWVMPL